MKKLLAGLFTGIVLAVCCAGFASAAVLDRETPVGGTIVRTSCEVAYAVVIPADTEIPYDALQTEIGTVRAELMKIEPGRAVYVEIASKNHYNLVNTRDAAHQISYVLKGDQGIVFNKINDPAVFPLTVGVTSGEWAGAYAGEHRDTLIFTISYR